jgi:hypothetical protein
MKNAIAHIGGTSRDDILELPEIGDIDKLPLNDPAAIAQGVAPPKLSAESLSTLEAI